MILPLVGAVIAGLFGYNRYVSVKAGDLVRVHGIILPDVDSKVYVTAVDGIRISGTLAENTNNMNTGLPVSFEQSKVIQNLTPRLW